MDFHIRSTGRSALLRTGFAALATVLLLAAPARADFPAITPAQKSLTSVPGHPNAPAVVLFDEGDLIFRDDNVQRLVTIFNIRKRVKILNQEGVDRYGDLVLSHSRNNRLSNFQARTVLPDGTVVPVGEDAVFERRSSRSERVFETAIAFPSVEPGAILDYSYEIRSNSPFLTVPWVFQDVIPTLHSEITYHPSDYHSLGSWGLSLPGKQFQTDTREEKDGRAIKVWLDDLPPVPDEPWGPPLIDLSARFMMYIKTVGQSQIPVMQDWRSIGEITEDVYRPMLKNDGRVKGKARELIAGLSNDRQKAEALYAFVRDEIALEPDGFVYAGNEDRGVDGVLAELRGAPSEQALLLHSLLDNVKIGSDLVWASAVNTGRIDPSVPNPFWFDRVLVRVALGGETLYLDPSDDSLAFGALSPFYEGSPAVVMGKKPEVLELPGSSWSDHGARADLDLAVGEDGRITGSGTVVYRGHEAWNQLTPGRDAAAVDEFWMEELTEQFAGYAVSDLTVTPAVAERKLTVAFSLAQKEEDVLGDEVTVVPTRPLGPRPQTFELPPERRLTPVQLPWTGFKEVVTTVTWPEGWEVEQTPKQVDDLNPAGTLVLKVERPEGQRELTVHRRLEVHQGFYADGNQYDTLRKLHAALAEHDAQPVVLVKTAG